MSNGNTEEFKGIIGRTTEESTPWWTNHDTSNMRKTNIVFIVLDDLGFSQLGCYGSDILTPNIDRLAENGLRYNNFHTTAMCSPSRAALLTGRNPHSTGVSFVTEVDTGFPNSRGKIRKDTALISEMLLEEGYNTFAIGKWHLAPGKEQTQSGPFDGWPLGRGFEQYYGFLRGATSQFYPDLVEGNRRVSQPKTVEEGYHLTEDLTDKAIEYICEQKSVAPNKPFFCYLSYAAPHAPHQAPKEFIDKNKGKYDKGWDKTRKEWFERQKELGIIPKDTILPQSNPGVKPWDSFSEDEKRLYARMQEAFAGFLEHTDYHIGRFIDCLKELNQFDNTLIVLLSDNGACSMGGEEGRINNWEPSSNAVSETLEEKLLRIDQIGGPYANSHYPAGWAQAGNTPLRWYKNYTHAGGIRCPLIIHYPEKIKEKGEIRSQFHHITDITPTVLELLDMEAPEIYKGIPQKPIYGTSMLYSFHDAGGPTEKKIQHYEINGNRAIWKDGWKAVTRHVSRTSFDEDEWELYCTEEDFSEINNLAKEYPKKLRELVDLWWMEAEKYDVFPIDGRSVNEKMQILNQISQPDGPVHRTFTASPAIFISSVAPDIRDKQFQITAEINRSSKEEDGVLVAHGDLSGGYCLFIQNNRLIFHYNFSNREKFTIESYSELPIGSVSIKFTLLKGERDKGIGLLHVNDNLIGKSEIGYISSLGFSKGLFYIGQNERAPICSRYKAPFKFKGHLKKVVYTLGGYPEDLETPILDELLTE